MVSETSMSRKIAVPRGAPRACASRIAACASALLSIPHRVAGVAWAMAVSGWTATETAHTVTATTPVARLRHRRHRLDTDLSADVDDGPARGGTGGRGRRGFSHTFPARAARHAPPTEKRTRGG